MNQKKQIEQLQAIVKEQNNNIKHLKEAILWIHEPPNVRLGHLDKITNNKLTMAFPDEPGIEEYYYSVSATKKEDSYIFSIDYVKESELNHLIEILERSSGDIEYDKMTISVLGQETYLTTKIA